MARTPPRAAWRHGRAVLDAGCWGVQHHRRALIPSAEQFGLRVMAAKPSYILAMKLAALERFTVEDRDYQDAINLGAECRVTTTEGLRAIFRKYFGDEPLPRSAELRLRDLANAIKTKLD